MKLHALGVEWNYIGQSVPHSAIFTHFVFTLSNRRMCRSWCGILFELHVLVGIGLRFNFCIFLSNFSFSQVFEFILFVVSTLVMRVMSGSAKFRCSCCTRTTGGMNFGPIYVFYGETILSPGPTNGWVGGFSWVPLGHLNMLENIVVHFNHGGLVPVYWKAQLSTNTTDFCNRIICPLHRSLNGCKVMGPKPILLSIL